MRSSSLLILLVMLSCVRLEAVQFIDPPTKGRQYETLTFRFAENLKFANPFDLETNRVELAIVQPDFSHRVLSFFYDGPDRDNVEQWEARFAPKLAGLHRFTVRINGIVQAQFQIPVSASQGRMKGGLRLADRPGTFVYESGEAFRGIGMNICWADNYEYYFRKMKAAGMNVTRIWMCPWHLCFEWTGTGLGRYNVDSARALDQILELAEKYGVYVILCMDFHGIAPKGLGFFRENRWAANPYNRRNGGPCADASELFTSEEAKMFYKRRYKYLVSRFGHSSHIAAWEFFNEADLMAGRSMPVNRWHIEMAEYIHSVDVHERLVSTSSTRRYPEKVVDAFKSPAMDFVMFHDYNSVNMAPFLTDLHEATLDYYQKPVVIAEFGIEYRGGDRTYQLDPQHVGLHNGIWAGWFSETPMIPLSWWWDSYIDRYNIWGEFGALSRFAEVFDLNAKRLSFRSLIAGRLLANPEEQVRCMVRCIYTGGNCALWFKNEGYQWSLIHEGKEPKESGAFAQMIPDLAPGRYSISWFDPQTGTFVDKKTEESVGEDGALMLSVPSFSKDLACMLTRLP